MSKNNKDRDGEKEYHKYNTIKLIIMLIGGICLTIGAVYHIEQLNIAFPTAILLVMLVTEIQKRNIN